jgi:hypothetical protein
MTADPAQHHRRSGGDTALIDVFDTRPGGPNRQERAHRVGAPESPAEEIEEMGMLQVHACVSVHCDQCGEPLGDPEAQGHYPSEDAALNAAATQRWRVYPGGRLRCSACALASACEVEGHEFTPWRHPRTERGELLGGSQYRHCRRCCVCESRLVELLAADVAEWGTSAAMRALLVDVAEAGEVA